MSGEADLVSVTKAGYMNEFEIKCSRGDFLNEINMKKRCKRMKHNYYLTDRGPKSPGYPSRFWFVTPHAISSSLEIPEHAGLIHIYKNDYHYYFKEIKEAPRLHENKVDMKTIEGLAQSLSVKIFKRFIEPKIK